MRGLGIKVDEALQEYRRSGDLTPVREAMHTAYGEDVYDEGIATMDEGQLLEAAGNVTRGVPIVTPARRCQGTGRNDALTRAGFDESGQSDLYDGRSGEKFARKVTMLFARTIWWMTRSTPVPLAPTASSPSSWAVRRSSAVSASVRWKSGL